MGHSHANHREITLKVVYYGPGLAGKTTILTYLHQALRPDTRGQLISVTTGGDQTLFFDFFPLPVPRLQGNALRVQIYTAPGDIRNDSTRRALLEGVDGLVFMADSQRRREMDNVEALEQLRHSLAEMGLNLDQLPYVFAWNKRDLDDVLSADELSARLNARRVPAFETVASSGRGAFDTLKAVTGLVLGEMSRRRAGRGGSTPGSVASAGRRLQTVTDAQRALAVMTDRPMQRPDGAQRSEGITPNGRAPGTAVINRTRVPTGVSGVAAPLTTGQHHEVPRPPRLSIPTGPEPTSQVQAGRVNHAVTVRPLADASSSVPPGSSEETQPRKRSSPTWLAPLAPDPGAIPQGPPREVWISHLLPRGPLRDQLHDVEVDLVTGRCAQAVRRATGIFAGLTSAEAGREPEEGQAWPALALGIPVDRYLRFREAARNAAAGTAAPEDGLFALFFLLDVILRR